MSFFRVNLSIRKFCAAYFFTDTLSLSFATARWCLLLQSAFLKDWTSSKLEFSLLSTITCSFWLYISIGKGPGLFMIVSVREHLALNNCIFWRVKAHHSVAIIITIPTLTLISSSRFENLLSLQFWSKIFHRNFPTVLGNLFDHLFNSSWKLFFPRCMRIQSNIPVTSEH